MTPEEFIEWVENLPLQTLTDELKQDIIDNFNSVDHGTSDAARQE
jgi:hypothetical protein